MVSNFRESRLATFAGLFCKNLLLLWKIMINMFTYFLTYFGPTWIHWKLFKKKFQHKDKHNYWLLKLSWLATLLFAITLISHLESPSVNVRSYQNAAVRFSGCADSPISFITSARSDWSNPKMWPFPVQSGVFSNRSECFYSGKVPEEDETSLHLKVWMQLVSTSCTNNILKRDFQKAIKHIHCDTVPNATEMELWKRLFRIFYQDDTFYTLNLKTSCRHSYLPLFVSSPLLPFRSLSASTVECVDTTSPQVQLN